MGVLRCLKKKQKRGVFPMGHIKLHAKAQRKILSGLRKFEFFSYFETAVYRDLTSVGVLLSTISEWRMYVQLRLTHFLYEICNTRIN